MKFVKTGRENLAFSFSRIAVNFKTFDCLPSLHAINIRLVKKIPDEKSPFGVETKTLLSEDVAKNWRGELDKK